MPFQENYSFLNCKTLDATSRPLILAAMPARRGVRVFGDQPRHSLFFVRLHKSTIVFIYCLCIQLGTFPEGAMHHIFTVLQRLHIVGIPLEHFLPAVQILSVVVCPAY